MKPDPPKRDFLPKKEVRQQIDNLEASGQPLHHEQDVALTPEDSASIKRMFFKVFFSCLLLILPFALGIYFFPTEEIVLVFCAIIIAIFVYAILKAVYQLISNLRTGRKTIIRGIITDRFTRKHYGAEDEDGDRDEKIVHYLKVGNREFVVDKKIYGNHKTGEAIEMEYILSFHGKPFFLHNRKLKGAGLETAKN